MSESDLYSPLTMIRSDLENIPEFDLSEGFSFHWYQSGNENHWVKIHELADTHNDVTLATFENQYGYDRSALKNRMLFLQSPEKKMIGTITSWYDENFQGQLFGRIHWVAIIPEFQGQGLSKPMLSAALLQLKNLEHTKAYLTTIAERKPAVQLYKNFGFVCC